MKSKERQREQNVGGLGKEDFTKRPSVVWYPWIGFSLALSTENNKLMLYMYAGNLNYNQTENNNIDNNII